MSAFKYFTTECSRIHVLQLSHENECEVLLPHCRVGVKESGSKALATHTKSYFLIKLWYESDDCMTRQAASDRQHAGCTVAKFASGKRLA